MEIFLQQLVNSLSVASVIILIGIGITLIFGLTGIINFAHGEFLMLGGIGDLGAGRACGGEFLRALLVAVAVSWALLGFLLERGLFRFTLRRPMNGFIVSLGLIVILQHVVIRIWNSYQKSIPDPLGGVWQVGEHPHRRRCGWWSWRSPRSAVARHLLRDLAQPLRPCAARERRRPGDRAR